MFEVSHAIKIIQLLLFFVMCWKFRPTLRWTVITSLIPTLSLIQAGSYESGDFVTHIVRAMDMFSSLQYGIFPVRWAWLLQGGYGYPLFSFMTVLPYYLLSALRALNISFVVGLKLCLVGAYVGSATSMWLCARAIFEQHRKRDVIATVSALFYVFAPYTLINLEFRAAAGELMGFALFPLLLYSVLSNKRVLFALALTTLLLSHPGITLLGMPWIFLLIAIKKKWSFTLPTLIAGGLSAFYLIPALLEAKFTGQVAYGSTLWTEQTIPGFQPISWLFWSSWRYGFLLQGHYGEVANIIGAAQWGAIITVGYLFIRKQLNGADKKICMGLFILLGVGIFMMLPYSRPVWNILPIIRHLQFPSRMMFYIVFSSSIISGYVFSLFQFKFQIWKLILFICLGWTILNWSHRTFHPEIDDAFLLNSIPRASFEHERLPEAMPIIQTPPNAPRTSAFLVDREDAHISIDELLPTRRTYTISTSHTLTFQENTLYFPGWIALLNSKQIEIKITKNGTMVVRVPQGKSTLEFQLRDTPIRRVANITSILSVFAFATYIFLFKK